MKFETNNDGFELFYWSKLGVVKHHNINHLFLIQKLTWKWWFVCKQDWLLRYDLIIFTSRIINTTWIHTLFDYFHVIISFIDIDLHDQNGTEIITIQQTSKKNWKYWNFLPSNKAVNGESRELKSQKLSSTNTNTWFMFKFWNVKPSLFELSIGQIL